MVIVDNRNVSIDVQIINKPEPRKVEHLTEEEKLERQVQAVGNNITDVVQRPLLVLDVLPAHNYPEDPV